MTETLTDAAPGIRFYTLAEAAQILRCSERWLQNPANALRCGGAKFAAGAWLFTEESMRAAHEAALAAAQPEPAPPTPPRGLSGRSAQRIAARRPA